jgi:hypothetical protein
MGDLLDQLVSFNRREFGYNATGPIAGRITTRSAGSLHEEHARQAGLQFLAGLRVLCNKLLGCEFLSPFTSIEELAHQGRETLVGLRVVLR